MTPNSAPRDDFHKEIYIVTVDYEKNIFDIRVDRNDGLWCEEEYTEVAKTNKILDIGPIIGTDFGERREEKENEA